MTTIGRRRVGAVDCGTNATRLLVADVGPGVDGSVVVDEVSRELVITRMGEGIAAAGVIGQAALRRVEAALRRYAGTCRDRGVERVAVLATSAARDAVNVAQLTDVVVAALGVMPEVLTGEQEAAATFRGAVVGLEVVRGTQVLVVDVGGGSTELAVGPVAGAGADPVVVSLPLGCVRLTEDMLPDDPPTPAQAAAARETVAAELAPALQRLGLTRGGAPERGRSAGAVVAVAGTALTLGALHSGLDDPDARQLHGASLPAAALADLTQQLLAAPAAEIGRLPPLVAGREDVLAAGALILDVLVGLLGADGLVLSRHDLLDDLARRTAAAAGTTTATATGKPA